MAPPTFRSHVAQASFASLARRGPRWALMYLLARFEPVRRLARTAAGPLPDCALAGDGNPALQELDVQRALDSLERDGIARGAKVDAGLVGELVVHFRRVCGRTSPRADGLTLSPDERVAVEQRTGQRIAHLWQIGEGLGCPALWRIALDPIALEVAARYLGQPPVFVYLQVLWTFAGSGTDQSRAISESFHYDLDDYRALRLFVFLSDVESAEGAHVCVRGSHKRKRLVHRLHPVRYRPDTEIMSTYPADDILIVAGKAGDAFFEDPYCFHKGTPIGTHDRILLTIQYTVGEYSGCSHHRFSRIAPLPQLPRLP